MISSSTARSPTVIAKLFFPAGKRDRRLPARAGDLRRRASACGRSARCCSAISATGSGANTPSSSPITLMGVATAAVGLLPTYAPDRHRRADPARRLPRCCRAWRSAANMAARRSMSPNMRRANQRGFYTSFIQASVVGGFLLSLVVVLDRRASSMTEASGNAWGWRMPFLFSLVLLAVSLWMRLKLTESPVFQAMKEAGETARNPLQESFDYPGQQMRLSRRAVRRRRRADRDLVHRAVPGALFPARTRCGSTIRAARADRRRRRGVQPRSGSSCSAGSRDQIGRKKPIVIGYALTLLLLFPLFHWMAGAANPGAGGGDAARAGGRDGHRLHLRSLRRRRRRRHAASCSTICRRRASPIPRSRPRRRGARRSTIGGVPVDADEPGRARRGAGGRPATISSKIVPTLSADRA